MADFLDEKRREIDARMKELRPLVEEYNRLEKAAGALAGVGDGGTRPAARAPRRRGRGRPRGSGTRARQALELVREGEMELNQKAAFAPLYFRKRPPQAAMPAPDMTVE